MGGEGRPQLGLDEALDAGEAPDDPHRGDVEVGALDGPLGEQVVDVVRHALNLPASTEMS